MTKVFEIYYCDICGKECNAKPTGTVLVNCKSSRLSTSPIRYEEVCDDCCDQVFNLIALLKKRD